jgi:hypothetical protein
MEWKECGCTAVAARTAGNCSRTAEVGTAISRVVVYHVVIGGAPLELPLAGPGMALLFFFSLAASQAFIVSS